MKQRRRHILRPFSCLLTRVLPAAFFALVSILTSPIWTRPTFGTGVCFGVGFGDGTAIAPMSGSYFGVGVANGIGNRTLRSTFRENAVKTERPAKKLTIRDKAAVAIIRPVASPSPSHGQSFVRIVPSARR
jgi:hypothetical protein